MSQVDSGLPGLLRMIVADPIHEVEEFAAPKLGVEDLVNLELGKAIVRPYKVGSADSL